MAETSIGRFEIKRLEILSEAGSLDPAFSGKFPPELVKKFYEAMVFMRAYNDMSLSLQREGRIGTYASIYGQEAAQAGSALAISKEDWVFPTFRENGALLTLGYPAWMLLRYWKGDERGMKVPEGLNVFPMSVPVGTQIPHAVGAAMAMKYKGKKSASIVYFGDGGSSRGDAHEAMNMAGVYKAPCVFICENNQWAISVPRSSQTAALTIAQRAWSYGFDGVQVDGNDVFAVYKAVSEALDKARSGGGPTLIESFMYRLDDHTTADDASRYRSATEVNEWRSKEPMIRLTAYMRANGLLTGEYEAEVAKKAKEAIEAAVKEEELYPPSAPDDILRYTNAKPTLRQIKEMKERGWLS